MTLQPLTAVMDPSDEHLSHRAEVVLASLPGRYRVAPDHSHYGNGSGYPTVALVSGNHARWPQRIDEAASAGAQAVVLSGTGAVSAAQLAQLAGQLRAAGVIVAVDTRWASNITWADAVSGFRDDLGDTAVVDSLAAVPAGKSPETGQLRSMLVEQLAVVEPLLSELAGLTVVHVNERSYVLAGTAGADPGTTVTLAGALTGASGHELELAAVGTRKRWRAQFSADAVAAPTRISYWDEGGQHAFPLRYENASRGTWLNVYDAVRAGHQLQWRVERLVNSLTIAERALGLAR